MKSFFLLHLPQPRSEVWIFFFPPHSRVQSCSILRGVARAHRVGVVPNCTMGLFLERYRFCHWLLKRCTGKWVKTCTPNTVPSAIRPISEPVLKAISKLQTNKWTSVGTSLPPMLTSHRWKLYKGQNTNKRVRVVCDEPIPNSTSYRVSSII